MATVNILGTTYEIVKQSSKDNKMLENCNGYCDWTVRKLYIRDYTIDTDDIEYENIQIHINKTIRHEIIHTFLFESGLWNNSFKTDNGWAVNEEMIDYIAIQFPKILKVFQETECL